ncbi:MAG: replicative DNA helicase [bacterium]
MAGSAERVPPFDAAAERAVIGSILLNGALLPSVMAILSAGDFYSETNRIVFQAICTLHARGMGIDHVTLGTELETLGSLDHIGGAVALDGYTDGVAAPSNVEHYAAIVREKAAVRRIIYAAQKLVAEGFADTHAELLSGTFTGLQDAVLELTRTRMPASLLAMGDRVLETYDRVAHGYRGVPLPWPTLSAMTSGLWPKTMTMFVARPGVGKTLLAVLAARHAWMEGYRVLIVSPEMGKEEIAERFFAVHSPVSYMHLVRGTIGEYEMPRLQQAVDACRVQEGLWIMDSDDDLTPRGIEAAIRACQPTLIAIDSLYDLRIKGERRDKLLVALEWFKGAVKRFDMAGIGFVQLNRAAELSEKKGGGVRLGTIALADEIGQDSHAVFALEQDKDMRDDRWLRIKPLKLRRGQGVGNGVRVHWDFDQMLFDEIPEDPDGGFNDEGVPF